MPSSRPLPSVELGDHYLQFASGTVTVPIQARHAQDTEGLQLIVAYDPSVVEYNFFDNGAWELAELDDAAPDSIKVRFTRRPGAGADSRPDEPVAVGYLGFSILNAASDENHFRSRSPLTILQANRPNGSFFYSHSWGRRPGRAVDGELHSGSISVYHRSGFEIGWGEVNATHVSVTLPLFLTYTGSGPVPLMSGGIDYDELFFRHIKPVSPPLDSFYLETYPEPVDRGLGKVSFEIRFRSGLEGPLLHEHVADVFFTYENTHVTGDQVEVTPILVLGEVPRPHRAQEDGAAGGAPDQPVAAETVEGLRGGIGVISVRGSDPIHFQRGNVTSKRGELDISSARRILDHLFLGGPAMPCQRAADVDANTVVEITDAVMLLNRLFNDGPPPAPPYPEAGFEPTEASPLPCRVPYPYFRAHPDGSAALGH